MFILPVKREKPKLLKESSISLEENMYYVCIIVVCIIEEYASMTSPQCDLFKQSLCNGDN